MKRIPDWLLVVVGAVLLYPIISVGGWLDAHISPYAFPSVVFGVIAALAGWHFYSGRSGGPSKRPARFRG